MFCIDQLRLWIEEHEYVQPAKSAMVESVVVDSRLVRPNSLYFALPNETSSSRNGHEFLVDATARGAILLCVERGFAGPFPPGAGLFKVADSLASLQKLARNYLAHCRAKVIAITGSIGKTTTTHLLGQIAASHLPLAFTEGNQNGRIGLPLTLLNNLKSHHKWIALEMGMDRPGQLAHLTSLAPPSLAVITAIEPAHMDHFSTLSDVARAKGEILFSPQLKSALLNADSHCHCELQAMGRCIKKIFSSRDPTLGDFGIERSEDELIFYEGGKRVAHLAFPPKLAPHHLSCLLAAVALSRQLDLTYEQIASRWSLLSPPGGRFTAHQRGDFTLIDDSYNASPTSVLVSLAALPEPPQGGRRLALLAPMEELGHCSQQAHLKVGEAAFLHLDGLICLDPMADLIANRWRSDRKPLWRASSLEGALEILRFELGPSDILLIKGSRRWGLEMIVDSILRDLPIPQERGLSQ